MERKIQTTDDSVLNVHVMASSSEVSDTSKTHTRPSVEPVARLSGWLGWNLTYTIKQNIAALFQHISLQDPTKILLMKTVKIQYCITL